MRMLNKVLTTRKFLASFWNFGMSFYNRGTYNRFSKVYKKAKEKTGVEQYINQNR